MTKPDNQLRVALRYRREAAKKSQAEAAEAIGITQSHYGKIERGALRLALEDAATLARLFECRIEDLI